VGVSPPAAPPADDALWAQTRAAVAPLKRNKR
jgi:hypothetical protein